MRLLFLFCFLLAVKGVAAQKKEAPDSAQIKATVIHFYKWYNLNRKKPAAFKLYKGKEKANSPPYVIDWAEAERYFAYLRKSVPYIGEGFIATEKRRLLESEEAFQKFPEDEVPAGFDYDPFTNSQEDTRIFLQELLKGSKKWRITFPEKGQAHVSVLYPAGDSFFCSDLVKEKSAWKIIKPSCEDGAPAAGTPPQKNDQRP